MNKETVPCTKCGNVNEVKVSSGHSKPENKGKKYTLCTACKQFDWVNGNSVPTQQTVTPSVSVQQTTTEEKVDWNAKDRQSMAQTAMKSASEIVAAIISSKAGLHAGAMAENPTTNVKDMANEFYKELLKMKQLKEDYP